MSPQDAYASLIGKLREVALIGSAASTLEWDMQTQMPEQGIGVRGEQLELLSTLRHARFTDPAIGELLAILTTSDLAKGDTPEAANIRETQRDYTRACKLPGDLVGAIARQESVGQKAWEQARKADDFSQFEPHLRTMVGLKQQAADAYGHDGERYDALLEEYEPGATTVEVASVLEGLRGPLVELVAAVKDSGKDVRHDMLERKYPGKDQAEFARFAAQAVGFDFDAGRIDVSAHPFCTGLNTGDTRITTRYDENFFGDAFFGTLHEAGHGMYEQGLPKAEHFGTPMGESVSLGIHESQSRMWENAVGRSAAFWKWAYPLAQKRFKDALWDITEDEFVGGANAIRPTLIRTESDETTYNLHILLRFELERALLAGDLDPKDLPGAWTEKMTKYLGVVAPSDADGCLQDVHWSAGLIGYFPTYTLGNLYAAQLFEKAREDLGDLDDQFAHGHFAALLTWLRENIHQHGRRYTAGQLCERVTGKSLSSEPLLRYLRGKAKSYYGV
ncbi:MAG: carboxypeptidase M32 [Planctomycetota bacterium]